MTTDHPASRPPAPDSRQTTISGNANSGIIAGGDIRGGVTLNSAPPPPMPAAAAPAVAEPAAKPIHPALRILFLASSPVDNHHLRLDQEVREIDLALRQSDFRDRIDLRQHHALRHTDLQAALLRHRPQILHFSGHGEPEGLCFEDEAGQTRSIPGSLMARILGVFKKQIRCVVLNACHTQSQAETIAKEIDCVIGMSTAIGDRASTRFSSAFYQALAFGSSVEMAFQLGCAQIDLDRLQEGDTPRLIAFKKDPGEIVFVQDEP
jgi:CHAT domain